MSCSVAISSSAYRHGDALISNVLLESLASRHQSIHGQVPLTFSSLNVSVRLTQLRLTGFSLQNPSLLWGN